MARGTRALRALRRTEPALGGQGPGFSYWDENRDDGARMDQHYQHGGMKGTFGKQPPIRLGLAAKMGFEREFDFFRRTQSGQRSSTDAMPQKQPGSLAYDEKIRQRKFLQRFAVFIIVVLGAIYNLGTAKVEWEQYRLKKKEEEKEKEEKKEEERRKTNMTRVAPPQELQHEMKVGIPVRNGPVAEKALRSLPAMDPASPVFDPTQLAWDGHRKKWIHKTMLDTEGLPPARRDSEEVLREEAFRRMTLRSGVPQSQMGSPSKGCI